jgi:toxin ParE1/3/4
MRLIWTRRATGDLAEIRSYIARDNPPAASRIAARIRDSVARLADRYIVAYRIEEESVTILAVIHAARQWPRL